jgi:hypothetical protein
MGQADKQDILFRNSLQQWKSQTNRVRKIVGGQVTTLAIVSVSIRRCCYSKPA